MIFEHAQLTLPADGEPEFLKSYPGVRDNLRAAPGCRSVDLHKSVDRPDVYLLRVGWDNLSDHTEIFPETDQGRTVLATLGSLVESVDMIHFAGTAV